MESNQQLKRQLMAEVGKGLFRQALERLDREWPCEQSTHDSELVVVRAELLDRLGRTRDSGRYLETATRLKTLPDALRARCSIVAGRIAKRLGHQEEAVEAFRKAVEYAERARDPEHLGWARLRLMKVLGETNGADSVADLRSELRRHVVHIGSIDLTVAFHVFCAELEARKGALTESRRLTALAESLATRSQNTWLHSLLNLQSSCLAYLEGDFAAAIRHATLVAEASAHNGDSDSSAAALTNLAAAYVALGHISRADSCISSALASCDPNSSARVLLLETLAEAKLAEDDLESCEELLALAAEKVSSLRQSRESWYRDWAGQTRARLLCRKGHTEEADGLLERLLLVKGRPDTTFAAIPLEVMRAALWARTGRGRGALELALSILTRLPRESTTMSGHYQALIGAVVCSANDGRIASPFFSRSLRLLATRGDLASTVDVAYQLLATRPDRCSSGKARERRVRETIRRPIRLHVRLDTTSEIDSPSPVDALEVVSAISHLQELSSEPSLIGEEAIRLLRNLGWIRHGRVEVREPIAEQNWETVFTFSTNPHGVRSASELTAATGEISACWEASPGRAVRVVFVPSDDISSIIGCVMLSDILRRIGRPGNPTQSHDVHPSHRSGIDYGLNRYGVFDSTAMQSVVAVARRIAGTKESVLLVGESGTGKEVFARIIHDASSRASQPLLPFNCASVPRDLFDSHLFGHRKGAFTGATESFAGLIRAADGGTIFLDEVGDLPLEMQPKLLRFLDSMEVHPLGETRPQTVDVRIIAATNAPLEQMVAEKKFREDLYYRLNVFKIHLPPLRERREDIPALVKRFAAEAYQELGRSDVAFSDEAVAHLMHCDWPGNVRQLAHEVRRLVALADPNEPVSVEDISTEILPVSTPVVQPVAAQSRQPSISISLDRPLEQTVAEVERAAIEHALQSTGGRNEETAKRLGLSRKGLYLKRRRLGL